MREDRFFGTYIGYKDLYGEPGRHSQLSSLLCSRPVTAYLGLIAGVTIQ